MKKIKTTFFLLPLLILTGCASNTNYGQRAYLPLNQETVKNIQKKYTTTEGLRALFGLPQKVKYDWKNNIKQVIYAKRTTNAGDKGAATLIGAGLGGLIGHQFGKGNGKKAATIAGTLIGGSIGRSSVDYTEHRKILLVLINMKTDRVIDYRYDESLVRR